MRTYTIYVLVLLRNAAILSSGKICGDRYGYAMLTDRLPDVSEIISLFGVYFILVSSVSNR